MSWGKAPCHISSRRHLKGSNARFETSAREWFRTCDRFCAHLVRTNWRACDFKTEGTRPHFVPQRNASTSPTWWRTFYGFPGFLHPPWTALYPLLTHPPTYTCTPRFLIRARTHTHTHHANRYRVDSTIFLIYGYFDRQF